MLRVEEHPDRRDAADEVTHAENETRCEAVHPVVRLVDCVGSCHRPPVARLDTVDRPERHRAGEQPDRIARTQYPNGSYRAN